MIVVTLLHLSNTSTGWSYLEALWNASHPSTVPSTGIPRCFASLHSSRGALFHMAGNPDLYFDHSACRIQVTWGFIFGSPSKWCVRLRFSDWYCKYSVTPQGQEIKQTKQPRFLPLKFLGIWQWAPAMENSRVSTEFPLKDLEVPRHWHGHWLARGSPQASLQTLKLEQLMTWCSVDSNKWGKL